MFQRENFIINIVSVLGRIVQCKRTGRRWRKGQQHVSNAVLCLEDRLLLTTSMTNLEQQMLYDVNRVRVAPQGELNYLFTSTNPKLVTRDSGVNFALSYFSVDTSKFLSEWSALQSVPPLAFNENLYSAADGHNAAMIAADTQSHQLPGEESLGTRAVNAGYTSLSRVGENVYAFAETEFYGHAGFLIDWGNATPGHRNNIMNSNYKEAGIRISAENNSATSVGPLVITQDFGSRFADTNSRMVGVVYSDSNTNSRYDAGEGIGGATISITGASGTFFTTSLDAGGWQYQLPAGAYTVSVTGSSFAGTSTVPVTLDGTNREVDFVSGVTTGYINFAPPQNTGPTAISLTKSEVAENLPGGTTVGVLSATDPTANDTFTFSLVSEAESDDNGSFTITNNTLKSNASFDYEAKKTYSIRVRATDSTSQSFDRTFMISVTNVVEGIVINSPNGSSTDQRPLISWTPVAGAQSYDFWLSRSPGTAALIRNTVSTASYVPATTPGIGAYNVWVRATVNGAAQKWSEQQSFTITSPVIVNSVAASQETVRPTITWTALPGAAKYDVWIDDVTRHISQKIRVQNAAGTSFTPAVDLPIGQYTVWVRGIAADGTLGKWSTQATFRTLQPPTLQQNAPSTFDRTPRFTWGSVAGAVKYEFFLRNLATGATTFYEKNLTATSFAPSTNVADGSYRWWAIAVSEAGIRTLWSAPADLSIGGQTSLLTPAGSVATSKPVFTWSTVTDVARYDLYVDRIGGPSQFIREQNLTLATFTPTTDLALGSYRAWVRAISTSGLVGAWSRPVDFTV